MTGEWRKLLETRRKERIESATRRLLDGEEVLPDLQQIDAYSRLLAATEPKRGERKWLWPAAAALICVTTAGILWSLKIPRTNVSMTVDSDTLAIGLERPWHVENVFHSALMHVERLSTISAPNLGLTIDQRSGDAWFELKGGVIELQTLDVGQNASLEIYTDQDSVDLYASRARVSGRATVMGKVTVTAGPRAGETSVDRSFDVVVPETIEFSIDRPQSVPSQLSVRAPDPWSIGHPQATQLSFAREELRGMGERWVTSGIKGGTIRFDDTAWPVMEVRERDFMRLRLTPSTVLDAHGANGVMHVTVNGAVSGVRIGSSDREADLAPSYLEYLYNKKSLGLFWGAMVFVWGLIWGLRNTVLR